MKAEDRHLKYVGECNLFFYQTIKCILKQVPGYCDDECNMKKMLKAEILVERRQSKIELELICEVCIFICKMF